MEPITVANINSVGRTAQLVPSVFRLDLINLLASFLAAPDVHSLSRCCQWVWYGVSTLDELTGKRILRLANLSLLSLCYSNFEGLFQRVPVESLVTLEILASKETISDVIQRIAQEASKLRQVQTLKFLVSSAQQYLGTVCDTWVSKLAGCIQESLPSLKHLSLPYVILTSRACTLSSGKAFGTHVAASNRPMCLDMHFAMISTKAWQGLFKGFYDALALSNPLQITDAPQLVLQVAAGQDRQTLNELAAPFGSRCIIRETPVPSHKRLQSFPPERLATSTESQAPRPQRDWILAQRSSRRPLYDVDDLSSSYIRKHRRSSITSHRVFASQGDLQIRSCPFSSSSSSSSSSSQLPTEAERDNTREMYREKILEIYRTHNPEKMDKVEGLLTKYAGKEKVVYLDICTGMKHNVTPQMWLRMHTHEEDASATHTDV